MTLSEFETKRCEKLLSAFIEKCRPPPNIRNQVDIGFNINDQSVKIFEIRPNWKDPKIIMEIEIAKATYIKSKKIWKLYWFKSDMKWHLYQPNPEVKNLEEFITIVDEDKNMCFWG